MKSYWPAVKQCSRPRAVAVGLVRPFCVFAVIARRYIAAGIVLVLALAAASFALGQDEAVEIAPAKRLGDIRAALARRDLAAAKTALANAKEVKGNKEYQDELERLDLLTNYVEQFWQAVVRGASSLQGLDELKVGETVTAVVEVGENLIILRVNGQNKRYSLETLPAAVSITLAERALDPKAAVNKVIVGSFHLMDGKGKRDYARRLLNEAQTAGVDVKALMPELETLPASPPLELPPVPLAMRRTLAPSSWKLLQQDESGAWKSAEIDDVAKQNAQFRLAVAQGAAKAGARRLVLSRKLTGNFGCQMIVTGLSGSEKIVVVPEEDGAEAWSVTLPVGDAKIEFAQRAGQVKCLVNGAEAVVARDPAAKPPRTAYVALEIPAAAAPTIAAILVAPVR